MRQVLILRPEPGADATARRAEAAGFDPVVAPLFSVRPQPWHPPEPARFDAVVMTSANAARWGGNDLAPYRHLPLFAVGAATAAAAHEAGFGNVVAGQGDGAAILGQAVAGGARRILHLAGRDYLPLEHPDAVVTVAIVYAVVDVGALPEAARVALEQGAMLLLHSPRAARVFAALVDAAGLSRDTLDVVTLSPAIRAAVGEGWRRIIAAETPDDNALLAAARLCDQAQASLGSGRDEDEA